MTDLVGSRNPTERWYYDRDNRAKDRSELKKMPHTIVCVALGSGFGFSKLHLQN